MLRNLLQKKITTSAFIRHQINRRPVNQARNIYFLCPRVQWRN